ncbi:hypothetical protein CesoFtcFv8_020036 [Champsocephalus esox]|uniref:Uncharacterized protein n=1 Tax=Champsocephalus esox TaxID=159716 RepID=A0AAN8BFV4_9TELE|nr:hypothetical protein CesoFtcFv8_020036 [Champsocephalus esox]
MLSCIDRNAGKVSDLDHCRYLPALWHSLELCTHNALLLNQAGTGCVAEEHPAAREGKHIANLSITTRVYSVALKTDGNLLVIINYYP